MPEPNSNPFSVNGKVVLVTGGTRGLGRAISVHLASYGAHVIAGYFQNDLAASEFSAEAESLSYSCEVIKANLLTQAGIQKLVDTVASKAGKLDCFVHNAATGVHQALISLSVRHLSTIWNVNVGAFFDLATKLKPFMTRGSRIIAISSEGALKAIDAYGAVGSSKAALEALCRQMAAEWAGDGITANIVAPGLLETDTLSVLPGSDARVRDAIQSSPIGRMVSVQEVSCLVHFLCSAASTGIVGQTLTIDGGKCISSIVH